MVGNGLRPQIWGEFTKRFNIPWVAEFYGATEGNCNAANIDNKFGSVGFLSVVLPDAYPVKLIKVDENTMDPIRNKDGMCINCKPGEPGELVGKIVKKDPLRRFDGYAVKKETEKKLLHDVFSKGDTAFRSGDVLVMDEYGYLYFRDRTGDTYRWKGENVSTAEVEATLSNILSLTDVVVYGVPVPGTEGKAGMAAIEESGGSVDLKQLVEDQSNQLPSYARPLFVRLRPQAADKTGTFKFKKVDLVREGFDPDQVADKLFFLDVTKSAYVPLTKNLYDSIISGSVRV